MKDNIRYKVLEVIREKRRIRYYSSVLHGVRDLCLEYIPGQKTTARTGTFGIFVFRTMDDAEDYMDRFLLANKTIRKVEVWGKLKLPKIVQVTHCLPGWRFLDYLNTKKFNEILETGFDKLPENLFNWDIPPGTEVYKSVRLIEEKGKNGTR